MLKASLALSNTSHNPQLRERAGALKQYIELAELHPDNRDYPRRIIETAFDLMRAILIQYQAASETHLELQCSHHAA
jgi:hypothetical protein